MRRRRARRNPAPRMSSSVVYSEVGTSTGSRRTVLLSPDGRLELLEEDGSNRTARSISSFFCRVFLPEGFPSSVSSDYLAYQGWDTLQAFASSIASSLSTKAVLKGVGVGDESATPLAATLTWLLRHGAGMLGQILFTWVQGSDLDHNCKKWRLFADILNDAAMLLELSGPLWPKWSFQFVLCAAGVSRSLVGVAGSATRAAVTQHQARANNISDVAAKDGSQETLVNLAGLILNLFLLSYIGEGEDTLFFTWILFFGLISLHLFANYKAVKALKFSSLNKQRLLYIMDRYFRTHQVCSVAEANLAESVILGSGLTERKVLGKQVFLGDSFKVVLDRFSSPMESHIVQSLAEKLQTEESSSYLVLENRNRSAVTALLRADISEAERLEAYVKASFVAKSGENSVKHEECREFMSRLSQTGWDTTYARIPDEGWVCRS